MEVNLDFRDKSAAGGRISLSPPATPHLAALYIRFSTRGRRCDFITRELYGAICTVTKMSRRFISHRRDPEVSYVCCARFLILLLQILKSVCSHIRSYADLSREG